MRNDWKGIVNPAGASESPPSVAKASTETFSQGFSGGPDAEQDNPFAAIGPKHPPILDRRNFNGLWRPGVSPRNGSLVSLDDAFLLENPPLTDKAKTFVDELRVLREDGKLPSLSTHACRSPGIYSTMFPAFVIGIAQTDDSVFLMFELPRLVRKIHLDARHPENLIPSYAGHSIGWWEGDTLVVDTIGFNGLGELDISGAPISDKAHMIERYKKAPDGRSIQLLIVVDDPENLTAPLVLERRWILANGVQHGEYDCEENPREDMSGETVYFEELYEPVCVRVPGEGIEQSRIVCNQASGRDIERRGAR